MMSHSEVLAFCQGIANLYGWWVLTYKKSGVKTRRSGLVVTRMIV